MRRIEIKDIEGIWRHEDFTNKFYIDFYIQSDKKSIYTVVRKDDHFTLSNIESDLFIYQSHEEDAVIKFDEYSYPVFHLSENKNDLTLDYGNCRRTFKKIM